MKILLVRLIRFQTREERILLLRLNINASINHSPNEEICPILRFNFTYVKSDLTFTSIEVEFTLKE